MTTVLVLGATGYVGGSVAVRFREAGYAVSGMCRSEAGAAALSSLGIAPIVGSVHDRDRLRQAVDRAEVIVNAVDSDDPYTVETVLDRIQGRDATFIQTSGSSVVGDKAEGRDGARLIHEDTPIAPLPERAVRLGIDQAVLDAANRGVRSVVLRPPLIYGRGLGPNNTVPPKN